MNYRHAFHAGNFADVVKHALIARIVEHLKKKDKAFRCIDTHAGIGLYDLSSGPAQKTGEWRDGIGRVMAAALAPPVAALLEPLNQAVRQVNPDGGLTRYPGSPFLVRSLLRGRDRLTAIELHPEDARALKRQFDGDFQVRVIELDGWLALGAHVPPKEKRGLVIVDPPFEEPNEFERLVEGLKKAHGRWPGGAYALWYPVKDRKALARFRRALIETGIARILDCVLTIRPPSAEARFDGTGLIVVNPPFTLEAEAKTLLAALAPVLAESGQGGWSVEWLAGEA
ncbi:MAG: 23S rRNA (adenine(2030)-N(6))-methyltransferase RlmJ [Phyllobacteriaceae bacterium]|nr:23S rRNA (adenine(2030)-N(6))-methyltransferase RlmJ [Phyllobacteriaceae bacterium]